MEIGYIKLYRKILKSDMYVSLTPVQRDVMMTCLMLANHTAKKWEWNKQVFTCNPGQFITSLDSLVKVCAKGVSKQMVRTSLLKLEKWQFLTNKSTQTGRLITIVNWGTYQGRESVANIVSNKELTKHQHSSNIALTPNKNVKNVKNVKKSKEEIHTPDWVPKVAWSGFVEMRKKSKSPFTDRAKKLALTELEKLKNKGYDSEAVLNQSVMNGWKGLFEVKDGGGYGRDTRAGGAASGKNPAGGVRANTDKYAGVAQTFDDDS